MENSDNSNALSNLASDDIWRSTWMYILWFGRFL